MHWKPNGKMLLQSSSRESLDAHKARLFHNPPLIVTVISQRLVALNSALSFFSSSFIQSLECSQEKTLFDHQIKERYPDGLHVLLYPPAKRLLLCLWSAEPHSAAMENGSIWSIR
ncbi:hypothetical protein F2P81_001578 [Scophthalmus maximus]|uniref:Uncharacterized protein n=1 Tax=Scophthalmus maximus TaxID=52904 RepID=A0A6A4TJQ6_SCOMX|nr:hypothetical protein F2P81_001578 [Scophthalmus maximus]